MYRLKTPGIAPISNATAQHGAALVISMIILLVMTVIAVTSLRTTTLEERMAGNMRDRGLAFESAEAALVYAQEYIDGSVVSLGMFDSNGSDGLYDDTIPTDKTKDIWDVIDWTGSDSGNTNKAITATAMTGIKSAPKFVIQHYGSVEVDADKTNLDGYGDSISAGEVQMFKITVRATGGSDTAAVLLQVSYGKLL